MTSYLSPFWPLFEYTLNGLRVPFNTGTPSALPGGTQLVARAPRPEQKVPFIHLPAVVSLSTDSQPPVTSPGQTFP